MKDLDYFRKLQAAGRAEIDKLSGTLDKLRQDRAALEEQITAAIDAEELDKVERLTAKESELDNRIRAAEKILERKREKTTLDRDELAAANNAAMQKGQAAYNAVMEDANRLKTQYFKKLLEAAEIVTDARNTRSGYLTLAGVENPHRITGHNGDFKYVTAGITIPLSNADKQIIAGIAPDALKKIRTIVVDPLY